MKHLERLIIFSVFLISCEQAPSREVLNQSEVQVMQARLAAWESYKQSINDTYVITYRLSGFYFSKNESIKTVVTNGQITNSTVALNESETMDSLFEKHLKQTQDDCHHDVTFHDSLPIIKEVLVDCGEEGYLLRVVDFSTEI